ncbi:hypothetical protein [Petroclostridium sp. X23]|uniref:hypothetical protein n=1 Tax=Petroclostridium sp. X23 TaxID=3045146 RepID=UPI0024AE4C89|nr:hypothetical protein [Petroclostridium sp. X23]WHH58856.1 hypothetical protein QKW49_24200 [Petroclostridium sp. X23]
MSKIIMGIEIGSRVDDALEVQKLLTENGCIIKTRIGLHEASKETQACSRKGLVLLEFIEDVQKEIGELEDKLAKIDSVVVKKMVF